MSMPSNEFVVQSVAPKSDQLNADDLIAGPIDVTIVDVKQGNAEQPIVLFIDGDRQPYKPCKSMRRILIKAWGESAKAWINQRLRLYCDPDVKFGGMKVGGIRVSHMTGIKSRTVFILTVARGKRAEFTIDPLDSPDSLEARVNKAITAINGAGDVASFNSIDNRLAQLFEACDEIQQRRILDATYAAKQKLGIT